MAIALWKEFASKDFISIVESSTLEDNLSKRINWVIYIDHMEEYQNAEKEKYQCQNHVCRKCFKKVCHLISIN